MIRESDTEVENEDERGGAHTKVYIQFVYSANKVYDVLSSSAASLQKKKKKKDSPTKDSA